MVTGTRIREPGLFSASPLTDLQAPELRAAGAVRIEDVLNRMPQLTADQTDSEVTGATGTATANLRGLGAERTLVLIDGKRLMPGDPTSGSVAPDLNFIPTGLVNRIEVVTGGASAVYGSDAIAGVVNFILKRDFEGLQLDVTGGISSHSNGNRVAEAALTASNIGLPASQVWDGQSVDLTATGGLNFDDGRGNVSAYVDYRRNGAVIDNRRDFGACGLSADGGERFCAGSPRSTALGHFAVINPVTFDTVSMLTLDPTGPGDTLRQFNPTRDAFNFAPFMYFQRPDERYAAGTFAHYAFSDAAEAYADVMYMNDETTAQLAPSGLFFNPYTLSCDNPMFSADEVAQFCTEAGVPPGGDALIYIGRRNVEAGGRRFTFSHRDYRAEVGLRGTIDDWHYDISAQHSAVAVHEIVLDDVLMSHAADALDVVRDGSGRLVCASGNPGCVPYDIFSLGGVTRQALDYLDSRATVRGSTDETVVSANATGQIDGIVAPWTDEPLSLAVGAEYRREGLTYDPDQTILSGDLASNPNPAPPVSGRFDVSEVYGEFRLPIAQDNGPFLSELALEGGYRLSWYSRAGLARTFKAGLGWSPMDGLTLRASFNRAVRAPNADDLFTPKSFDAFGLGHDPCAGTDPLAEDPFATPENCLRTGVSAAQYGHVVESADSYNSIEGGNLDLKPESANTFTVGIVLAPKLISGFQASIDYYDIDVANVIASIGPDATIERCLRTGLPFYCHLVHRAPGTGSLWITPDGYVTSILLNAAALKAKGVDLDATYVFEVPSLWDWGASDGSLRLMGTYVLNKSLIGAPGSAVIDCTGQFGGNSCATPVPVWRHTMQAMWNAPGGVGIALTWRYIASVRISNASSNPAQTASYDPADRTLGDRSYFDVAVTWQIDDALEMRVGANNIFDRDPPLAGQLSLGGASVNGNTYAGTYDALGRWIFAGATIRY